MKKQIHIISGGTFFHVRPHLALAAPAFGQTGVDLYHLCDELISEMDLFDHPTKMADNFSKIETNQDVSDLLDKLIADPATKIIFLPVALCDFEGFVLDVFDRDLVTGTAKTPSGKDQPRLQTKQGGGLLELVPAEKIINKIRRTRKDIFLVGFKTTSGVTEQEQYLAGLNLCKSASCNLVLANDIKTRINMIITPEEAAYHVSKDRQFVLRNLVEMTKLRSHLTFTQSTVIQGESIPWESGLIPSSLREVVNYCIKQNAYKPFRGSTAGHFAVKLSETEFLTSKRKTDFNNLSNLGLIRIKTDSPDTVLAYGAKPSVGGQSQRIVFKDHPDCDCIVHFHCPMKPGKQIPIRSQREFECGSHQCGQNTSNGLQKFGNLYAVYLDQHGPNIVFNKNIDPREVISFIEENFDLSAKTGGYNLER